MVKQFLKKKILIPLTLLASAGIAYFAPAPAKAETFDPTLETHTNFDEQERQLKEKYFGKSKIDLTKTSVSASLMALLTEKCSGASGSVRTTFRPENNIRIYVDASGSIAGNKDQTVVAGEAGGKFGIYFPSKNKVTYFEAGASAKADKLKADDYNLDKLVTSLHTKVGIATKDFLGDLTLKFNIGRYDGKAYGQNLQGDVFGVDAAAYAEFKLDELWTINASLRVIYEKLKNLWESREIQTAAGINYITKEFAAQFAPYFKLKTLDSGMVDRETIGGFQLVARYSISDNVDIVSGYSWDNELGHQGLFYLRFKTNPKKKAEQIVLGK